MQRIVVDVRPAGADGGDGWTVGVHLGAVTGPLLRPAYRLAAVTIVRPWGVHRVPIPEPAHRPGAGEPHADLCAGDQNAIGTLLKKLAERDTDHGEVRVYGRWLFDTLLGPAWEAVLDAAAAGDGPGIELALRWQAGEHDLHRLVWEAMHVGPVPLAAHPDRLIAITRLVPVGLQAPPSTITGMPRVMLAAGAAWTDEVIRPGVMYMGLLRALDADGRCTTKVVHDASIHDVEAQCRAFRPDVVHIVAHGSADVGGNRAGVYLTDGHGGEEPVTAAQLVAAVSAGGGPLAVALSACETGLAGPGDCTPTAAELVEGGVPFVSAMAGEVSELACRLYIRRLVDAVHRGRSFIEAAAHGRRAALLGAGNPANHLDWAMAASFVAEPVDPAFRMVDTTLVTRLLDWADKLKLRHEPVFVGRQVLLDLADTLVSPDPDDGAGFVAITCDGEVSGLGGTRLLKELSLRLLRNGHAPLLLGPYSAAGPPTNLRTLIAEVLERMVRLCEVVGIEPVAPEVFGADPELGDSLQGTCSPAALAALGRPQAVARVRQGIARFRTGTAPLVPTEAGGLLGEDLARFTERVRQGPAPFGPDSCVVVLGDDVHKWDAALGALLELVSSSGLGTEQRVPVAVCASLTQRNGPALKTFKEEHHGSGGFRFPDLAELEAAEAVVGYQWVLLHPWRRAADDRYRKVYTPAPDKTHDDVWNVFSDFARRPEFVQKELYTVAQALSTIHFFRSDDDDRAFADYVRLQLGGAPTP